MEQQGAAGGLARGWADHANAYLREIEVGREIDHRSLEAQREEKLDVGTGA